MLVDPKTMVKKARRGLLIGSTPRLVELCEYRQQVLAHLSTVLLDAGHNEWQN